MTDESTTATVEESIKATVEEPTTATVKGKRIRVGRILWILVLALVILLLAGFALRNYIPMPWLQQIRVGNTSLPALVAQTSRTRLNATLTAPVNTMPASMPGMVDAGISNETSSVLATPTASVPATTRAAGIVTVITMTPTANVTATAAANEATPTATATQTTVVPATATPAPAVTLQLTSTLPVDTIAPTITPELAAQGLSPDMEKIKTNIQDLYQILQASQVMMQIFQHGQPTEAELVAMKAQLSVVDQRLGKLVAALQLVQPGTETFGPEAKISPENVRQLFELMRQSIGMVRTVLSDPNPDSATFAQAQILIEQLEGMMGQIYSLVIATTSGDQPTSIPAALTPTIIPSPTGTLVPTAMPIQTTLVTVELSQLQAMLRQMEEMLRQMQLMLDQIQN